MPSFIEWNQMQDPYYWHYRCAGNPKLVTRIDFMRISDEKAEQVFSRKLPNAKFSYRFCGKEHEGYLERSKFGQNKLSS